MGNIYSYNSNTRDGEDEGKIVVRIVIVFWSNHSLTSALFGVEINNEELQKIRKGLTRRQKREYESYRTDQEKLIYLKAVRSERKRRVCLLKEIHHWCDPYSKLKPCSTFIFRTVIRLYSLLSWLYWPLNLLLFLIKNVQNAKLQNIL